MSRKPKSRLLGELHEIISGLYVHGMVDKQTMREFDEGCFLPEVTAISRRRCAVLAQNEIQQKIAAVLGHYPFGQKGIMTVD